MFHVWEATNLYSMMMDCRIRLHLDTHSRTPPSQARRIQGSVAFCYRALLLPGVEGSIRLRFSRKIRMPALKPSSKNIGAQWLSHEGFLTGRASGFVINKYAPRSDGTALATCW